MTVAALATAERRQRILGLAQARGQVLVTDLSGEFGVSEVTIRADLTSLARRGLLVRTHGGALVPERAPVELTFATREVSNVELKRRIGAAAAALVLDGQSVVLDASTTALQMAEVLRSQAGRHDVTVITNGVQTALALLEAPGVGTILTGGQLRATAVSLTGALASDLLGRVHATVGFFGAIGLTVSHGLTDVNVQEVEMKAAMAAVCERVVAIVDHTKLGKVGLATFVSIEELSLVITDAAADAEHIAALRDAG